MYSNYRHTRAARDIVQAGKDDEIGEERHASGQKKDAADEGCVRKTNLFELRGRERPLLVIPTCISLLLHERTVSGRIARNLD